MAYKYTHFIPQNIAPKGAKRIGVYGSNGNQVTTIPLGRMAQPTGEKLYSFGIVSDIHLFPIAAVAWTPETKFDNALTYFETAGCAFCVACGDLTQSGFYLRTDDNDASTQSLDTRQFAKYKEICEAHTIPVYELMGNHESYYGMPVADNLALMETYTGNNALSYTVTQGNDLFILCGQPKDAWVMSGEDFLWLQDTLAANTDRRCFVFVHSYIEEDSGDPKDFRENSIFETWASKAAFMSLLAQNKNVVLFHGHSHTKFESQEFDKAANYTERNGFKSVHIPSLGTPRTINTETGKTTEDVNASQGYIVDVYEECIILNGRDFVGGEWVPAGVLKISTK